MRIASRLPQNTAASRRAWTCSSVSAPPCPLEAAQHVRVPTATATRRRLPVSWTVGSLFRPRWKTSGLVRPCSGSRRPAQRGSAVLIVLVLLACMAIVAFSNVDTLASLKKEIQLIDRQQQQRYEQSPGH